MPLFPLAVVVLSSGLAGGQAAPPGNLPPVTIASLPDAPMLSDVDTARSGANGAPEYSNATPQVKQSIEDQSDDQESPAAFRDHLIRDRFLGFRPIQLYLSGPRTVPLALFRAQ
jgi:hypothetical protein